MLAEIKAHPMLEKIPVVVYTTSIDELEARRCYEAGASSFVTKPDGFDALVNVLKETAMEWLEIPGLPCYDPGRPRDKHSESVEVLELEKKRDQNTPR